jgi:hypothetical protein
MADAAPGAPKDRAPRHAWHLTPPPPPAAATAHPRSVARRWPAWPGGRSPARCPLKPIAKGSRTPPSCRENTTPKGVANFKSESVADIPRIPRPACHQDPARPRTSRPGPPATVSISWSGPGKAGVTLGERLPVWLLSLYAVGRLDAVGRRAGATPHQPRLWSWLLVCRSYTSPHWSFEASEHRA